VGLDPTKNLDKYMYGRRIAGITISEFLGKFNSNNYQDLDSDECNGKIPLFECPGCGAVGCGTILVRIKVNDASIEWREFETYPNDSTNHTDEFKTKFIFNKKEYKKELLQLRRMISKSL